MIDGACRSCGKPNEDDCLGPEGQCFECSLGGQQEAVPDLRHVRDMFVRLTNTFGFHLGELAKTVRQRWWESLKKKDDES